MFSVAVRQEKLEWTQPGDKPKTEKVDHLGIEGTEEKTTWLDCPDFE